MRGIPAEESGRAYALGWAALLAFASMIAFAFVAALLGRTWPAAAFAFLFLLVLGGAALKLWAKTAGYLRWGAAQLVLEGMEPAFGGTLRGRVRLAAHAPPSRVMVRLVGVLQSTRRDSSGNRRTEETEAFSGQARELALQRDPKGPFYAVDFALPTHAPDGLAWQLRLASEASGLSRSFPLELLPAGEAVPVPDVPDEGRAPLLLMVAANLLPLALLFAGYASAGSLLLLYWAENVVVGFYAVLRMAAAARSPVFMRLGSILFFSLHYGMFCFVHGIFVAVIARVADKQPPAGDPVRMLEEAVQGLLAADRLLVPLAALFVSHGISLWQVYLRSGRYRKASAGDAFWRPYPRLVVLHVMLLAGTALIVKSGSPLPMVAALILAKTGLELLLRERR